MSEVNKTLLKATKEGSVPNGEKNRTLLAENKRLKKRVAELELRLGEANLPTKIKGEYDYDGQKYVFTDGHTKIRTTSHGIVGTEYLLAIAAGEKAEPGTNEPVIDKKTAVAILDNLVEVGYGYFVTKGEVEAEAETESEEKEG